MFRNEVGYLLWRVCFNPLYRLPAAPAVVVWKHDRALIRTSQEETLLKEKSPFSPWLGKTEKDILNFYLVRWCVRMQSLKWLFAKTQAILFSLHSILKMEDMR